MYAFHLFYPVAASLGWYESFFLHLPVQTFSELDGEATPPTVKLTALWSSWIFTLGFYFLKVRIRVEYYPFNCSIFIIFLEGLQSGLRNLMSISMQPSIEDTSRFYRQSPYFRGVSLSILPLLTGVVIVV